MKSFQKMMSVLILIVMTFTAVSGYCEKAPWDCPGCDRTGNTGNFCGGCGHAAPQNEAETATVPAYNPPEYVDQLHDFSRTWDHNYILLAYTGNSDTVFVPDVGASKPYFCPFSPSVTRVVIPQGVTNIYAISGDGIQELFIPASVTSIERISCARLEKINLDPKNNSFTVADCVLFNKAMTKLLCYPRGKQDEFYTIPSSVEWVENTVFQGKPYLKSVTLSPSMKTIQNSAFWGSSSLKTIIIPNGVAKIEDFAFGYCNDNIHVTIPPSVKTIGKNIFKGCANPVIEGKKGSYAETYAKENNITFIPVE